MAVINNLPQYHAAIAAVCPIHWVAADGEIFHHEAATRAEIDAAAGVAASYSDVVPQLLPMTTIIARMTEAEYAALTRQAAQDSHVHRTMHFTWQLDVALDSTQAMINDLVAAGVLTAERAAVVFAPLPVSDSLAVQPRPHA
jgi:hypothetical protein